MNKQTQALKLALEALENTSPLGFNMESDKRFYGAITAIREALAEQPAQQHWLYDPMTGKPIQDEQPAQQGCMRCNTPKKCALYGCSPLTWPAEQPAISAGPITPAMMQGPTPEQKAQMVEAMSKLAEQPAQQQEPLAWMWHHPTGGFRSQPLTQLSFNPGPSNFPGWNITPLYTSPQPSKPWVGLTDEEIKKMHNDLCNTVGSDFKTVARATETKLREKNAAPCKPLTDEQIRKIHNDLCDSVGSDYKTMARAIEAAHGIKGEA